MSLVLLTLLGFSLGSPGPAWAVTRPAYCAALLGVGRRAPRAASAEALGDLRRFFAFAARHTSLRNQTLTDVDFRRAGPLARRLSEISALGAGRGVSAEFRGFDEVAVAAAALRASLGQTASPTPSVESVPGLARRAGALGAGLLPLAAVTGPADLVTGLVVTPLAAGLLHLGESGLARWRDHRDTVRGVERQLQIVDRVLDERERLAAGGRALSIVHGAFGSAPTRYFYSLFYTELRGAEPRWLIYGFTLEPTRPRTNGRPARALAPLTAR